MKPNANGRGTKKAPAAKRTTASKPTSPPPAETVADAGVPDEAEAEIQPAPAVEPPAEAPAEEAPAAEEPQAAPQPPEPDTVEVEPVAAFERVTVGHIPGVRGTVDLERVLGLLGPEALARVGALQSSGVISDLVEQMRVPDGRCAPVYMTQAEDGGPPALFAGYEQIAAAKVAGVNALTVVVVAAGDGEKLQSHLATVRHQLLETTDDDLIYAVMADDED